jgi:hypothetical protein
VLVLLGCASKFPPQCDQKCFVNATKMFRKPPNIAPYSLRKEKKLTWLFVIIEDLTNRVSKFCPRVNKYGIRFPKRAIFWQIWANPTIASYYASAVEIHNAKVILVRTEIKISLFYLKKMLQPTATLAL